MIKQMRVWGLVVMMLAVMAVGSVSAQNVIQLNQIGTGTIDAANPEVRFTFFAPISGAYSILVVEIEQGLAPQFTVYNPSGNVIGTVSNLGLETEVERAFEFATAGDYEIRISSARGRGGQFALRISPGQALAPVETLFVNTPVEGGLSPSEQRRFNASADPSQPLSLMIDGSVSVEISDSAGNVLGTLSSRLGGGSFTLPPGFGIYSLTVRNDSTGGTLFRVVLGLPGGSSTSPVEIRPISTQEVSSGQPTRTPTPTADPFVVELPTLSTSGQCVRATLGTSPVNVRRTPSTDSPVVGSLSPSEIAGVFGRNFDSSWYEIGTRTVSGWVAGFVTRGGGDCSGIRQTFIEPTATPTTQGNQQVPTTQGNQPTATPTATPTTASARIASDNEANFNFPYQQGGNAIFGGAISYPDGDRQDTVRYQLTNVPDSIPNEAALRYNVSCSGPGVEHAQIVLQDGQTFPCTPGGTNFQDPVFAGSSRSGAITVRLNNGSGAYVEWMVRFNWYIP